ncbi:TRAP transporter small permease [Anaerotignum sp.]|uniref:TRAP transporter small permease n=1 Tax=Anaerotignum sp. TaxID=2039241 RepID=UPI0028A0110F|nr:TRAP transporter small permease [Anaerotignum sp.]
MLKKFLNHIEEVLSAICLAVMTVLAFVNVIARYVFSASLSFTDEITTYLFVLLSLLGAAIAAKRGAHLGFTILQDIVCEKLRRIMVLIGYGFAVLFSGAICYYGVFMVLSQYAKKQITSGMQWPEWTFGSFVPVGAFFLTIRFLEIFIKEINHKKKRDEAEI